MNIQKISSVGLSQRLSEPKSSSTQSTSQAVAEQSTIKVPVSALQAYANVNSVKKVSFSGSDKSDEKLVLIPFGAPNAGKGTYSKIMSKDLGIPQISTGNILRTERKNKTALGLEAEKYMNAGKMVPDDVVIGMLKNRILEQDCKKGFILDGFPRTKAQAGALDEMLKELSNVKVKVLNIIVPEEVLYKRSAERMYCSDCGSTYNIYDPALNGKMECPDDGKTLTKRADDTPEVLNERLEQYKSETEPLIEYYENKGLLKDLDTGATVKKDVVIDDIMNKIYNKLEED